MTSPTSPNPDRPIATSPPTSSIKPTKNCCQRLWEWLFRSRRERTFTGDIQDVDRRFLLAAALQTKTLGEAYFTKYKAPDYSIRRISSNTIALDADRKHSVIGRGFSKIVKKNFLLIQQENGSWRVYRTSLTKHRKDKQPNFFINKKLAQIHHENLFIIRTTARISPPNHGIRGIREAYLAPLALTDLHTRYPSLTLPQQLDVCLQLLRGLQCLHNHKLVHQDLKPENFFLFQENGRFIAKIGDCDDASYIGSPRSAQTPHYLPKSANQTKITTSDDIYAMGISLLYMLKSDFPLLPPEIATQISILLNRMKHSDPTQRPNINDIVTQFESILARISHKR